MRWIDLIEKYIGNEADRTWIQLLKQNNSYISFSCNCMTVLERHQVERFIIVGNGYSNKDITECGALQLKFLLKNAFWYSLLLMPLSSLEDKILKRVSIINIMMYIWEKKVLITYYSLFPSSICTFPLIGLSQNVKSHLLWITNSWHFWRMREIQVPLVWWEALKIHDYQLFFFIIEVVRYSGA